ncbi:MAG TPA: TlpA disulfide reductase family protein [Pelobium sp.]|nr:TlpA disulfide reductase family protein [Pelobium sp.]
MIKISFLLVNFLLLFFSAKAQVINGFVSITDSSYNSFLRSAPPKVTGKILNASKTELSNLKISYSLVTPFKEIQSTRISKVDSDGIFILKIDYPLPYQQIWLQIGDYFYTAIYANKDLIIELDLFELKRSNVDFYNNGVRYGGADGDFNTFMNKSMLYKRETQLDISREIDKLSFNNDNFLEHTDSLFYIKKRLDEEFVALNPSPYASVLENERLSEYYEKVLMGCLIKGVVPSFWDTIKKHRTYLISNSSMIFYKTLYKFFKYSQLKSNFKGDALHYEIAQMDSVFGQTYSDILKMQIHSNDILENQKFLEVVNTSIKTPWVKVLLKKQFNLSHEKILYVNKVLEEAKELPVDIKLGNPLTELPFGAKLYVLEEGIKPEDLLATLKSSFNSKAIVLDFWATWCEPCIKEMPYSKTLQQEAKNLPIEFIYICTDNTSSIDRWRNKIIELKQPGTHLFVDQYLTGALMALFGKSAFPSYVSINQSGQVVKDNIQHMSSANLEDLKKLLRK